MIITSGKQLIPDAALKKHIAILGMNGSGKTSVAKSQVIEPALAAGERVCNIDPTGVGWGLRLSSTGKSKGFEIYVVGGDRADFPLLARDGKTWGEIVGTSSNSFVFDTSAMTVSDRSQWFTDFAETLLRKNRGPLKFVLDEAHLFAPQGGATGGGIAPRMLHATNNLLALGRSRGLRITMISQRPAKLHKDSLTQAHTLIAMMVTSPQDRAAVKDWIADQADADTGKDIIASLPTLAPGEGWIWAPRERLLDRVKFPLPKTYDSSSAPDEVEDGPVLTPIDPAAVKGLLEKVAKETVANDPAKLKARIAELERAKPAAPIIDAGAIKAAEQRGYDAAMNEFLGGIDGRAALTAANGVLTAIQHIDGAIIQMRRKLLNGERPAVVRAAPSVARRVQNLDKPAPVHGDNERPLGAERRPLGVLAGVYPAGMTEAQWAVGAGLKRTGGTWAAYVSRLRSAGRIEERGDLFYASETGIADLGGQITPLPAPGPELVDYWAGKINGVGPMLKLLADKYPNWLTRDELAENLNLAASGGTFSAYLSRLRSPGLIEEAPTKEIRAAQTLMESA